MSETKEFSGYLYINWKDDDLRLRKTKQNNPSPYEIVTKVSVDVEIPEMDIPEISKTIEVSEVQVKEAVQEIIDFDEFDGADLPEPRQVLLHDEEYLIDRFDELEDAELEEITAENRVNWMRDLLAYEYQNSHRDGVIAYLEDKLQSYKRERDD